MIGASATVLNPWLALPGSFAPRRLVAESWERALGRRLDPEHIAAPLDFEFDELLEYRAAHPLAAALPLIRRLLVRDADVDSGVVVAVGDAAGRLLWVEGDPDLKRRAEGMRFVEGSRWTEATVGTSAPGTALALDHGIQIRGEEHFAHLVQRWSCTAVPVHDPETSAILGVLDITGGVDVVAPGTLSLLEATAAAVESELLVRRLLARPSRRRPVPRSVPAPAPQLAVLGRDTGVLTVGSRRLDLSARHTEILTMLAWHRAGLSAEALADLVYGSADHAATLRPEMVRLRRVLQGIAPQLAPIARPYRLPLPLELDAALVVRMLDRGAHHAALDAYGGAVLPGSDSPGVVRIRAEVSGRMRETMLETASPELLGEYARSSDGVSDAVVWHTLLRLLPARSPKRAGIIAHLESLD